MDDNMKNEHELNLLLGKLLELIETCTGEALGKYVGRVIDSNNIQLKLLASRELFLLLDYMTDKLSNMTDKLSNIKDEYEK